MININPINATTIVQKLALYCSSYLGNDMYYLKQVVFFMNNLFGEELLIKMLKEDNSPNQTITRKMGEEWHKPQGMKRKLIKISNILERTNKAYSLLEDKTLSKEQREKISFKIFINQCRLLPKIENELYALFVFLIQNSSVQNMNISSQYLKVLERGKTFGGVQKPKLREEARLN